ncbi:MAG: hypothetical protein KDN20_01875 [Verrucomicrobiae bacterium]|nr:hypothetical protein [Verrucomicrobiae bacterium]
MKKGCIIAAIVVFVLGVIGIGGCVYVTKKYGTKLVDYGTEFANAGATFAIETAIADFKTKNPEAQIPTTNEAWAAVLKDYQMSGGKNIDLSAFIQNGKLVDAFQKELKLVDGPDGSVKAISPGKDGIIDTEDDVDSSKLEKLQGMAEGAEK